MRVDVLVSTVLGAIGGAVLGVLGSHVVETRRYMTKLETEVSKIKASYEKEHAEPIKEERTTEKKEEKQQEKSEEEKEEENRYRDKVSIYEDKINKTQEETVDYAKYSAPEKEEKKPETKIPKRNTDEKPYKITGDEYYNTFPEFQKVKATWWAQSHELIDEDETILDIDQTINFENLVEWPDDGVIFVRNVALGVDYEITFCDAVYDYDLY